MVTFVHWLSLLTTTLPLTSSYLDPVLVIDTALKLDQPKLVRQLITKDVVSAVIGEERGTAYLGYFDGHKHVFYDGVTAYFDPDGHLESIRRHRVLEFKGGKRQER
jgi:hypothetical protein